MDLTIFIIGFGLMLTGAVFFGYPIGLRHGSKMVADRVCNAIDAVEPAVVTRARRRMERRDILNAEVLD